MVEFVDELQQNSWIRFFSNESYRGLVTIPEVTVEKDNNKHNSWMAEVWIAEELFYYTHPFLLLNLFNKNKKRTKHEFEVQFKVIQAFTSINVEKTFFESYPSILSNQEKTKIKKYFIEWMQILEG